ncbi:type II secretion system F family protein [Nocardioides perillae]|uniref:Tight adherence protein B n=1 Tax=Nocardioides perillae TaxID=1119534 RepID=A0A7Y9UNC1_9ACTN|nr:type II secretion system F family protein [Nocardioides perillae]NYG56291.1 tight adherence protein B [Nocardioides perillae]
MAAGSRPLAGPVALLAAVAALALGLAPAAHAGGLGAGGTGGAQVTYVEATEAGLRILVEVPEGAAVDLDAVSVAVDGRNAPATAEPTGDGAVVERTTVLAVDTSLSMRGARFAAAKAAATTYLDAAPADVAVGIVTFDSDVEEALAPTTDRDAARAVVAGLSLSRETLLHDGVVQAVASLGDEGARSVLVLSDGADTSDTPVADVTAAISEADVRVDVVALDESADEAGSLTAVVEAGGGQLVQADPAALRAALVDQAEALGRQVLVTAAVPASVTAAEASIVVDLPTAAGRSLTAEAYAAIEGAGSPAVAIAREAAGLTVPRPLMYVGVVALGLGLGLLLVLLVPRRATVTDAAEERLSRWSAGARSGPAEEARPRVDTEAALSQAKDAAASVLRRNRGLELRIAKRLEAAGSGIKPAEWLLLQLGVFLLAGLVGLLLGGGSLVVGLVAMLLGALGPWLWLGIKRTKRVNAFNAALPDTLSLMSGSLSAGLSLAQSVDTIVREGTEPVASEFKRVLVETRLGVSLEDALEGVTERFESKDFGWVVMAIRIQRQVGGNLAELLDTVAATMREREYLRRQVRTLSAEGRLSMYVLGGLPPLFVFYLVLTQGDYVAPLFTEPLGWLMLATAGVLLGVGMLWMSRIVKVEV